MSEQQPLCAWCDKFHAGGLLDFGLACGLMPGLMICPSCADEVRRELEVSKLNAMWDAPSVPEDGLGPVKGIANALILSVIAWAVIWRMI